MAIALAGLAGLIALERLIELGLMQIGSRPLALLWAWVVGITAGLPQAELWAVLIACFGLLGLRSLARRVVRVTAIPGGVSSPQGTLQDWLELFDDLDRGEYFRWRLARRVAGLSDDLGLPAPAADPRVEAFLQAGRQLRTIRPEASRPELDLEPAILVQYLEGHRDPRGAR